MERGQILWRLLDQWLGPVLLLLLFPLRWFENRQIKVKEPVNIGFLKLAAIGDTVLLSAIIEDCQKKWPQAKIFLFVGDSNFALARLLPGIHQVEKLSLKKLWQSVHRLRKQRLDILIDADSWPRISAILAASSGAKVTVGFATKNQMRHFCYNLQVPHSGQVHELENYRSLVQALEVTHHHSPTDPRRYSLQPSTNWSYLRQSFFEVQKGKKRVLVHMWPGGTKSELKEWPSSYWEQFLKALIKEEKWIFVFTGTKMDHPRLANFLKNFSEMEQKLFLDFSGAPLADSIETVLSCDFAVCVNTGIMHIAAAASIPVLGLHGPTNPQRWGPIGTAHISVLSQHSEAACLNLGAEYGPNSLEIMKALTVDSVLRAWHLLVSKQE